MSNRVTAAEAKARADSAHEKIDSHEDICAERYASIHTSLAELKDDFRGQGRLLIGILLSIAGFGIVSLVAIILHALKLA